jgi:DNA-binding transcriptional regulator of glucitol operon
LLGQHSREVLENILRYDEGRIEQLFQEGIVAEQTPEQLEETCKTLENLRDMYAQHIEERNK